MTHMGAHGPTRAVASGRAFGNPRKGWLKDGQSPKGLVEGGARNLGGSRAEGGGGEFTFPPYGIETVFKPFYKEPVRANLVFKRAPPSG